MSGRRQMTIWDVLGPEPRESAIPSGWDRHWAQQIDPDAYTDAEVAAIVYPETRPSNGGESRRRLGERRASAVVMEPPEVASDARPKARRGRKVGDPDVGERLKKWRKVRGITQTRVAEMLGITQAGISSYERGKAIPAVARAERIEAFIREAVSATTSARGGRSAWHCGLELGLPLVIVRLDGERGASRTTEGELYADEAVTLVEDVVVTGSRALRATSRLGDAGARVRQVVSVLDRREGAAERFSEASVSYDHLFTPEELGID